MASTGVTRAEELRRRAMECFASAVDAAGGVVAKDIDLAGSVVRLRFAGERMARVLFPPMQHLVSDDGGEPVLTINVWDTASTGVSLPIPSSVEGVLTVEQLIVFRRSAALRGAIAIDEAAAILDPEGGVGFYCSEDVARIPFWEKAKPLRILFHWWLIRRSRVLVHGGAVGSAGGGVLIAGKGGSGKTTTTLTCLGSELGFLGDDQVVLESEPVPRIHSIYGSATLHPEDLTRFPELGKAVVHHAGMPEEKSVVIVEDAWPGSTIRRFPLRALVIPRVMDGREPRFREISRGAALAALAPSSLFTMPGSHEDAFQQMARSLRSLPVFSLELGSDRDRIPGTIADLLAGLGDAG